MGIVPHHPNDIFTVIPFLHASIFKAIFQFRYIYSSTVVLMMVVVQKMSTNVYCFYADTTVSVLLLCSAVVVWIMEREHFYV